MVLKTAIKQKIEVKIFPQQMLLAKLLSFSEKEMDRVIDISKNAINNVEAYSRVCSVLKEVTG